MNVQKNIYGLRALTAEPSASPIWASTPLVQPLLPPPPLERTYGSWTDANVT